METIPVIPKALKLELDELKNIVVVEQGTRQFFRALETSIKENTNHVKKETAAKLYVNFAVMLEEEAKAIRKMAKDINRKA